MSGKFFTELLRVPQQNAITWFGGCFVYITSKFLRPQQRGYARPPNWFISVAFRICTRRAPPSMTASHYRRACYVPRRNTFIKFQGRRSWQEAGVAAPVKKQWRPVCSRPRTLASNGRATGVQCCRLYIGCECGRKREISLFLTLNTHIYTLTHIHTHTCTAGRARWRNPGT